MPQPRSRDWRKALLKRVGAPVTPDNLKLLDTWQRWEGGHTKNGARFNWLNTTHGGQGAVKSINSVGVKAFDSFDNGVNALASTLLNGRYNDIVKGLQSGTPYKYDLSAGLSTWVSGSPTGGLDYAQRVFGQAPSKKQTPMGTGFASTVPGGSKKGFDTKTGINLDPLKVAFWDDPDFVNTLEAIQQENPQPIPGPELGRPKAPVYKGKLLQLPTSWKPTHVTDGLGWGTHSAIDIMAKAGTPVGAPEDGVVMRWNPTGAQGGGSMWFRSTSGKTYWLGHLDGGLEPGTRVKRGQPLAMVSSDHPRPHVHLDVR